MYMQNKRKLPLLVAWFNYYRLETLRATRSVDILKVCALKVLFPAYFTLFHFGLKL